jgi:hypothetical protein
VIIKGKSRGNGLQLGRYLLTKGQNEDLRLIEIRGVAATNVCDAVIEMDALALGTRTEKGLYSASINTPPEERLTDEQLAIAVDRLEAELGLTGQPHVVVLHEKKGRQHCHVVWSRIDLDRMAAISDSNNYAKHEKVARELEREFGLRRVQGAHAERDGQERPERTPSHAEMLQSDRTGVTPKEAKAQVTELWRSTDSGRAFAAALEDNGWILARGDRRDFVVIDPTGGVHSLARRVEGAKAKDIRERMGDLDPSQFPNIEEAKGIQQDRARGVASGRDQQQWEDKLLAAGLSKAQQDEKNTLHISERFVAKDLAWHEKQAARPYTATERRLMDAYDASRNDQEFVDMLGKAGPLLAVATSTDLETLSLERAVAFSAARSGEQQTRVAQLREGELVAINRYGEIRRLNPHKVDLVAVENRFTQGAGHKPGAVIETRDKVRANRPPEKQQGSISKTTATRAWNANDGRTHGSPEGAAGPARAIEGFGHAAASILDGLASIVERGISGDGEAQSDRDKAAEPPPLDPRAECQVDSIASEEDAKAQRRMEALRVFSEDLEREQGQGYERERDRSRR